MSNSFAAPGNFGYAKKCPWCGAEYPDEATRCLIDGELLPGGNPEATPPSEEMATAVRSALPTAELPTVSIPAPETDRRFRIIELVLVTVVAFGGSILASTFHFLGLEPRAPAGSYLTWGNGILHELASLGLVWYVLARRSRTFSDLGLSPSAKDVLWSILLYVGGSIGFSLVYSVIRLAGLTTISQTAASARVTRSLFGGGISPLVILFQVVNPFFEELIVRGYTMTEVRQLTMSAWKAVVFSTLLQMSYHFYQGAPLAFSEGATFAIFSFYYAKTNRLAPVVLAHFYMDWYPTVWFMLRH